ncbi:MAG: zeta toxin family protein [Cyclobacteriaceae bacterium]|nr:zeta toxin family protein [Cyclobacteriaceae bacterium]
MKRLYIIAGPNGAGKTTASYTVLPEILNCKEFVNADEIARGISPFNPEKVSIHAGRLMLNRIKELINKGETFAFETTLSSKFFVEFIKNAKEKNYEVVLLFLMLNTVKLAIQRVETRVKEGGHNIPPDVIERRYNNGMKNFFKRYIDIVDKWFLVDNSGETFQFIAEGTKDGLIIKNENMWSELKRNNNGN